MAAAVNQVRCEPCLGTGLVRVNWGYSVDEHGYPIWEWRTCDDCGGTGWVLRP